MDSIQGHTCACEHCDPELRVPPAQQGEHHVSVRFWGDDEARRATVLIDGEPQPTAYEALLGDDGIVWAYRWEQDHDASGRLTRRLHHCRTCRRQAEATGGMSPDGFRVVVAEDGTQHEEPFGVCAVKLRGCVQLMRVEHEQDTAAVRDS